MSKEKARRIRDSKIHQMESLENISLGSCEHQMRAQRNGKSIISGSRGEEMDLEPDRVMRDLQENHQTSQTHPHVQYKKYMVES